MNIIEISELSKKFGPYTVLNDVNVAFEQGKIHGIIGRNGAGKTVLFRCILGLLTFEQGVIRVEGKRVGPDIDVPENIGMILEGPGFLPNYSGYANLRHLARIRNTLRKDEIYQALEEVGLDPTSRKRVGKYSMGMRQRLCIAQAIMENPSILILDEPMNGLDSQGVEDIRTLLQRQRALGKTILLASHNQEDIACLCDTVHEIENGQLHRRK